MKKKDDPSMRGFARFIDVLNELYSLTKNASETNNIILSSISTVVLPAYTKEQRKEIYKKMEQYAEAQRKKLLQHKKLQNKNSSLKKET